MLGLTRIKHLLKRKLTRQIVLLGLALLLLQTSLTAAPSVKSPLEPPDASSPQATLSTFVEKVNRAHQLLMDSYDQYQQEGGMFPSTSVRQQFKQAEILFQQAQRTLNLSETPQRLEQTKATEGTLLLKEVLDRIEVPPYAEIPDAKAVAGDRELSRLTIPDTEIHIVRVEEGSRAGELSRWTIPDTEIHIVRVEEGSRAGEFLFSPETVARLEEFYQKVENLPYKPGATEGFYQFYISTPGSLIPSKINIWFQNLPSWLNAIYWDQTLWQWIALGISLLIAFWILYSTFRWNWSRVAPLESPQRNWQRLLAPIIAIASLEALSYFLDQWVNLTGGVLLILLITLEIILYFMVSLTIFHLGNALAETIIASPKINSRDLDATAIRLVFRVLSLTISIWVLIEGIKRVGFDIIPILAGLSVGALALSLGSQRTVENFVGGMFLLVDRPVSVGSFCRFGEKIGTVENIGLFSTRIRGIDRTVTAVPNADFSRKELVNFSPRDRILLKTTIGLRYETTSEQLRFVLAKLRSMLLAHPKLLEDPARVRLVKYGDYSQDVEIFVYADTSDWNEFLGIQEDVLLRVRDLVEAAGTGFAFPSQTAYLSRDSGVDPERSQAAEAEVQTWRSKGVLPFPEFPSEQREQFRDTLDFPPFGSPNARPDPEPGNNGREN